MAPASGILAVSCQRCQHRKKKCSRTLPRCEQCEGANENCSFENTLVDNAIFKIGYVRDLEQKVALLEQQLEAFQSSRRPSDQAGSSTAEPVSSATPQERDAPTRSPASSRKRADHLSSELRNLSLRAISDTRYLGPSSGESFGALTQAVLRRLEPDQSTFRFRDNSPDELTDTDTSRPSTAEGIATPNSSGTHPSLPAPAGLTLPPESNAIMLTEYYWAHSHTLYPFVRKAWFTERFVRAYSEPDHPDLKCPHWQYTFWLVLAIGSTTMSAVMSEDLDGFAETCFTKAMTYFDDTLALGNLAALDALLLQVLYAFFNKLGPNTWFLVGSALRLAIGLGLHATPTRETLQLPLDVQEYRKRLFWSLYMMDRVVSISLGRPLGIRDGDIEAEPFADMDDAYFSKVEGISRLPGNNQTEMAVPLHILRLRRISSEIFDQVYSPRSRHLNPTARDAIIPTLHDQLFQWWKTAPPPHPCVCAFRVPHMSRAWWDLNYNVHLVMLYRPSPLFPIITLPKATLLADAATTAITLIAFLHGEHRYAHNWLNLFTLFQTALVLIYTVTAQPDPIPAYLARTNALAVLDEAREILAVFAQKFSAAVKCRNIVDEVTQRLRAMVPAPSSANANADNGNAAGESPAAGNQDSVEVPSDDAALLVDFRFQPTTLPFGDAAQQFSAAGYTAAEEMELDDELRSYLDGSFGL